MGRERKGREKERQMNSGAEIFFLQRPARRPCGRAAAQARRRSLPHTNPSRGTAVAAEPRRQRCCAGPGSKTGNAFLLPRSAFSADSDIRPGKAAVSASDKHGPLAAPRWGSASSRRCSAGAAGGCGGRTVRLCAGRAVRACEWPRRRPSPPTRRPRRPHSQSNQPLM